MVELRLMFFGTQKLGVTSRVNNRHRRRHLFDLRHHLKDTVLTSQDSIIELWCSGYTFLFPGSIYSWTCSHETPISADLRDPHGAARTADTLLCVEGSRAPLLLRFASIRLSRIDIAPVEFCNLGPRAEL